MTGTSNPTLRDLRQRVYKHSGSGRAEIGNVVARKLGRPSAIYGTWLAVRLGVSANILTTLALVANLSAAGLIATGQRWAWILGVSGLVAGYWLDHVDGQVARWQRTATISGVYFDYLLHHATNLSLGFALGFGLAVRTGNLLWTLAGFLMASGWTLLSLHNDCRYKAIFQRLKASERLLSVNQQTKPRPTAPSRWPLQWPGIFSWPVAKMCEFHVVLVVMVALTIVAAASSRVWIAGWTGWVLVLAILAPTLALGRVARSISRGEVDAEFDSYFREE